MLLLHIENIINNKVSRFETEIWVSTGVNIKFMFDNPIKRTFRKIREYRFFKRIWFKTNKIALCIFVRFI